MKIGVTGNREGIGQKQIMAVIGIITVSQSYGDFDEFHHGDCVGVDVQLANLVSTYTDAKIIAHPPTNPKNRAFHNSDVVLPEKDYLDRNHDIVDAVDLMICVPSTDTEVLRSGTWATIRYTKKTGKSYFVIYPDGRLDSH